MFYDRDGKPISHERANALLGDIDYKTVARDRFGKIVVSTVWLGVDHGWVMNAEGSPPIIFESMVFGLDEEIQQRYSTIEEARRGHSELCARFSVIDRLGALATDPPEDPSGPAG